MPTQTTCRAVPVVSILESNLLRAKRQLVSSVRPPRQYSMSTWRVETAYTWTTTRSNTSRSTGLSTPARRLPSWDCTLRQSRYEVTPLTESHTSARSTARRPVFIDDAVALNGLISLLDVVGSSLADYRVDIDSHSGRGIDQLLSGHRLPLLADGQDAVDDAWQTLQGMSTPPSRP